MHSGINETRLFEELRLHPWIERDNILIRALIARLSVEDAPKATKFQELYDKKLADYMLTCEGAALKDKQEEAKEVIKVEEPVVKVKKTRKKSSPK